LVRVRFFQPFLHFFDFPSSRRISPVDVFTQAVYFFAAEAGCVTASPPPASIAAAAPVAMIFFMPVSRS
jgi:hypothetical protein